MNVNGSIAEIQRVGCIMTSKSLTT